MKGMLRSLMPLALAATIAVGCQTVQTTGGGAVGVDRGQMMMVSAEEVEQASGKQYQQLIAEARKKGVLNRNAAQVQRVRTIVGRLTAQSVAFRSDAPRWQWEVNVIGSDELNAWCMAGGKMAIYTGLIESLKLSDDEIAAVMGHEIAHALREHARERVSQSMMTGLGVSVAGALLGVGQAGQDLMGMVAKVSFELPNLPAVKLAGSPPARNLTHTFVDPPAFDKYAIHLPSGEMTAPYSCAAVETTRATRSNSGAATSFVRFAAIQPIADPPISSAPAVAARAGDNRGDCACPAAVVIVLPANSSSMSARASAMSRRRRRTSFSRQRCNSRFTPGDSSAGSLAMSGVVSRILAMTSDVVSPANGRVPASIS